MQPLARTWRDAALRVLVAVGLTVLAVSLVGCGASLNDNAKIAIVSAQQAQVAAGATYNDAKNSETVASQACASAAQRSGQAVAPPANEADWPRVRDLCASLGAPIPYNPFVLQRLAGPINSLEDLIQRANNVRVAFEGGTITSDSLVAAISQLASAFVQIETDLASAGISVPQPVNDAATTLKSLGAGK